MVRCEVNPHIVFVFPPAASFPDKYLAAHFNMCLGSAYTMSYLVKEGVVARPFLTAAPVSVGEAAARILALKPKVVGFTVYDTNYCICQLMARALKEIAPAVIVLFGGPTASVQAEAILKNNAEVDLCVRNEGEETCLELLSLLDRVNFDLKKAALFLETVKGITYRAGDRIAANPGRDLLPVRRKIPGFLDKYPSPYLSGILTSAKLGIITARGCDRHCVYCNCAVISRRTIATHSLDRVIAELAYLSRRFKHHAPANVVIYDDAFTLIPERALQICRSIIENKIKLPLVCATRCDMVNEELLESMKEAGFISIGFSLESAVPHVLRKIGKVRHPDTRSDETFAKEKEFIASFKKYILYAKKIGIANIFASIIVGLPGETLEEGQQTVNLIGSLRGKIDYYAHNIFKIYPGTPVCYQYKKHGIRLAGCDNQVHSRTIHAYDTRKIQLAPRSNLEIDSINQDKVNMKVLALSPTRKDPGSYFHNVILCADKITGELVAWLQDCLAVNGPLIQIYANLDRARQYHRVNEDALKTYRSPTTAYVSYYQYPREDGLVTLVPFRMDSFGKQCGFTIHMIDSGRGLSSSPPGVSPLQSLGIDRVQDDVLDLHRLLTGLAAKDNAVAALLYNPIYPYLSSLCRWEKGIANCTTLETVIVDPGLNIKTCWQGKAIGKVGMSFPTILANLEQIRQAAGKSRNCRECNTAAACMQCVFPDPITARQYCHLKKSANTTEMAGLIREFDFFKEL
jgi:anaerobic magnesium-protoporphyrin IX monomethyl ester cyclase